MSVFCDLAEITVEAGKGGNGLVSFRREKFIPFGGPDGGSGGYGADIYFQADPNINTLTDFRTHKLFKAADGEKGGANNCSGANGEDLILPVPVGTVVKENDKVIADLSYPNQLVRIAAGGRGGFGNAHFISSVRQAPKFAELGEDGEKKLLTLELKLIADVGLVGYPSVGKSTLISVISNAKPKIADYPFTTLIPNLGVVRFADFDFVVADIPGLIEGAHLGKGLGTEFLRHIQRTRVLVHILDVQRMDIVADYHAIRHELATFDAELAKKPEIVVLNKVDTIDPAAIELLIQGLLEAQIVPTKDDVYAISAAAHQGLKPLLYKIGAMLKALPKVHFEEMPTVSADEIAILKPHLAEGARTFFVERTGPEEIVIRGKRLEQIANMTDSSNPEGMLRLYDIFKKLGVMRILRREKGDDKTKVLIGKLVINYSDIPFQL
ncbi:MAG: GTPase ObgE [Candidatus Abawacabacteria bacterium]|nr:GTPase ObgE [Candidatus Abawacabacteria bacterium]